MDAITRACRTNYKAYHQSGTRPTSAISLIVLHSTEGGGSAKNVAKYFESPNSGGSAHLVVDDNACYRCLPNTIVPWGAPGANTNGFHIEQLGYAAWTSSEWLKHPNMLRRAAYKVAYHANLFHIPLTFVNAAGLKAGKRGVTTHAEVSKAFPNNAGNHHDPGIGYPMSQVLEWAKEYKVKL